MHRWEKFRASAASIQQPWKSDKQKIHNLRGFRRAPATGYCASRPSETPRLSLGFALCSAFPQAQHRNPPTHGSAQFRGGKLTRTLSSANSIPEDTPMANESTLSIQQAALGVPQLV